MDRDLRIQLLRAAARDRSFLKGSYKDLSPEFFIEREEQLVAKASLEFYAQFTEPIGALLRSDVDELARTEKLGAESKKKLKDLIDTIYSAKVDLVSVKALQDRVKKLKHTTFYENAVEQIVSSYETHKLDASVLAEIVERASKELHKNGFVARDYFQEIDKRIARRQLKAKRYPLLLIDPLDEKVHAIGRGEVGLVLASYASGKGLALVHIAQAYAKQGYRVLHFTLEDPPELVEDRLDASIAGIPLNRLSQLPNRLKKRFKQAKLEMHGQIKIIDATEGDWTVTAMERVWEEEKQNGFEADAIIIDYDDEVKCELSFKGESARRFEFAEIYKRFRKMARKLSVYLWVAAQTNKGGEGKKIVTGKDVAEDISKIRKVFMALGIGSDPNVEHLKYLNVLRHRHARSRFAVEFMSNYDQALFYDRDATMEYLARKKASS